MELSKTQLTALIFSVLIAGGIIGGTIDTEKAVYQCQSKNLLANCLKLGAENTRCYYNATNAAKYSYCPDKWAKLDIITENSGPSGVLINTFNQCSYICYPEGCLPCQ